MSSGPEKYSTLIFHHNTQHSQGFGGSEQPFIRENKPQVLVAIFSLVFLVRYSCPFIFLDCFCKPSLLICIVFSFLYNPTAHLHTQTLGQTQHPALPPARSLQPFPAYLPVHTAWDWPSAYHLLIRWRGTTALPGALYVAAPRPRAADGTKPRICAGASQPNNLRQWLNRQLCLRRTLSAQQQLWSERHFVRQQRQDGRSSPYLQRGHRSLPRILFLPAPAAKHGHALHIGTQQTTFAEQWSRQHSNKEQR